MSRRRLAKQFGADGRQGMTASASSSAPASTSWLLSLLLLLAAISAASACDEQSFEQDVEDTVPAGHDSLVSDDAAASPDETDVSEADEDGVGVDALVPDEDLVAEGDTDVAQVGSDVQDVQAEDQAADVSESDEEVSPLEVDESSSDAKAPDSLGEDVSAQSMSIDGAMIEVSPLGDQGIRLTFTTSLPAHASVQMEIPSESVSFEKTEPAGFKEEHSFQILGLQPSRAYTVHINATSQDGQSVATSTMLHQTSPLPADMPPIAVTVSDPSLEAPEMTLAGLMRWPSPGSSEGALGTLAVIDSAGVIRWHINEACSDFAFLANGNLLCVAGTYLIHEIDLFEGIVKTYDAKKMGLDTFHHAVDVMPNGNILTLSTEMRQIEYPTGDGKTAVYNVVGDVIVELQPDGTVVGQWKLLDLLDPLYVPDPFGFNEPFWNMVYPTAKGGTKDWSHANSISYDPADDSILVSLFRLDFVIKLKRSTGTLDWRFGLLGDFTLVEGTWPSHQHAAQLDGDGVLRLFDNGTLKMPKASRAVEYFVEPATSEGETGNAWQIWEFTDEQPFSSDSFGDIQLLSNGNVLIADSSRTEDPLQPPWDLANAKFSRLLQVTHTSPPQVVNEMVIPDPAAGSQYGYWIFKARPVSLD